MKIRTVIMNTDNTMKFDDCVNDLIADGWVLTRRDILPGMQYNATNWARRAHYAELVQPDPLPEPDPVAACDPFDLLRQLRAFCDEVPKVTCECGECPLSFICADMAMGKAIDELNVPTEESYGR